MKTRKTARGKRKLGYRVVVRGTADRPRLAVYRSNTRVSAQLIDDEQGKTLLSESVKGKNIASGTQLGKTLAEKAKAIKVTTIVFDRGGFRYHGAIKAVAESAREGGLVF